MDVTHVFFDIGGVLGTNGWDREQRARAAERFGLDEEFETRHYEIVGEWETGRITMAEYLESTLFFDPRPFSREALIEVMLAQSEPYPETLLIAEDLRARNPGLRLMTLNNEAAELNVHRIEHFRLRPLFSAFLSSCWLGLRKPSRLIFERALGIAQASAERVVFIDDREQNLAPARALGYQTVRFTNASALEKALADLKLL
jgi:putative hydrolase of the HAD superfamily